MLKLKNTKLKNLRDFDVMWVKICPLLLTLHVGLTTVQHYRAARENCFGLQMKVLK